VHVWGFRVEIRAVAQFLLQDANYSVSLWRDDFGPVTRFEDASVMGFVYEFGSVLDLLSNHRERERAVLAAHAHVLRAAGRKAWNVYSVFLAEEVGTEDLARQVLAIEEDLQMTRKIARIGVTSEASLRVALLPLLPISSQSHVESDDYVTRVSMALANVASESVSKAFFGDVTTAEIIRMMMTEP
jgi:hypothetical protein